MSAIASKYSIPKDARKAVRQALREGFVFENGNGRHAKLRCPDGHAIPIPGSPSDRNSAKMLVRQINAARKRCGTLTTTNFIVECAS